MEGTTERPELDQRPEPGDADEAEDHGDQQGGDTEELEDEVGEAFAECGMARDKLTLTFNALAVRTPKGVVLIDTGLGTGAQPAAGQMLSNLRAAGISEGDVSAVVISHFHGHFDNVAWKNVLALDA